MIHPKIRHSASLPKITAVHKTRVPEIYTHNREIGIKTVIPEADIKTDRTAVRIAVSSPASLVHHPEIAVTTWVRYFAMCINRVCSQMALTPYFFIAEWRWLWAYNSICASIVYWKPMGETRKKPEGKTREWYIATKHLFWRIILKLHKFCLTAVFTWGVNWNLLIVGRWKEKQNSTNAL